jgi:FKBP-type peptidyl-prolyl cis-trans isomerase
MQNKIIAAVAITIGLASGAGALWIWKVSQSNTTAAKQIINNAADSATTSASGASSNAAANNTLSINPGNQTQAQGRSQAATDVNSQTPPNVTQQSGGVVLDPAKFSAYDKYKDQQTASLANISTGAGAEAVAGKKALVNYRGWLTDGRVFDENIDPTKPFSFTLGAGGVIAGWEQGIAGMKVGGERLLIIPPAVGYGATGSGPIPGNAVLIFDVKLLVVE